MKHAHDKYNGRIVDLEGRIPKDEPVFLLRAQDKFAHLAVMFWAELVNAAGDSELAKKARLQARKMEDWAFKKVPDQE